ncbi:helix-turn-helix domain-containing protein [Thomasclavelia sp.]
MNSKEIGLRILAARKRLGYTQKYLGELINVSDKAVSKWERGVGCPDISLLLPLSEALQMSIDELIGGNIVEKNEKKRIQNLINYTKIKAVENKEKIIKISYIFICLAMILGVFIPCVCDFYLNHNFTWSVISSTAIVYAWIILTTLIYSKKNAIIKAIIAASIGVIPLLYVIAAKIYTVQWFYQEALFIGIFTNVYIFIVLWIWVKTYWYVWYKIGICIYLSLIINIPTNLFSNMNLISMIISTFSNIIIGTFIIMVGYNKRRKINSNE